MLLGIKRNKYRQRGKSSDNLRREAFYVRANYS